MSWDTVNESDWVYVPTQEAERHRLAAEKAAIRRARYETRNPGRRHGKSSGTPKPKLIDREFIAWDGEGPQDTGYSLFGNSKGMEICYPTLSTLDCFRLIVDTEKEYPDAIHIWFGGNYDASNIFRDLSWRHLSALYKYGRTVWRGWEIQHIPHKWLQVKYGTVVARIYDIRSFFAGGLVQTLTEWKIGPWKSDDKHSAMDATRFSQSQSPAPKMDTSNVPNGMHSVPSLESVQIMSERQMVETFKSLRSEFIWKDIEQIRIYMRLELKYTVQLMETLRQVFFDAGYLPHAWFGPGALARMALHRHNVYDAMAQCPVDVRLAAQYAFVGGRFEPFLAGLADCPVYVADLHSAYPAYATQLPNLNRGTWRRGKGFEPGKFAIYHIRYESKPDSFRPYPLPRRMPGGSVVWPYKTEGWYWQPEAELVADSPDAEFLEAHIFDEDDPNDKPFAFLTEYYRRRQLLKRIGNPAEWVFKLIINAIYGQLAQRAGWDRVHRSSPKSHQLEWAGYITSACRAAVYKVAIQAGDNLVSIDTDGVTSLRPFASLDIGEELGQWDVTEYDGGIFWQSGIYMLRRSDTWVKAKTRGIPKGSYTAADMLAAMEQNEPLTMVRKVFIGYGLACSQDRSKMNTWQEEPHSYVFGGTGKRMHIGRYCAKTCNGTLHRLVMPQALYGPCDTLSTRHYLPWLDTTDLELAQSKYLIDDLVMYDQNHLDEDDSWVKGWVNDRRNTG